MEPPASDMDGLFVDDLPRPAPRPRRKSKSTKEKRRNGRASERRRERGDMPDVVDGPPTRTSLPREERGETPRPSDAARSAKNVKGSGKRQKSPAEESMPFPTTTGSSGKLAYAVGQLMCVRGPEEGLSLKLLEGDYTIGRARENSFVLKDIAASREHLRIRVEGARVLAIDLGSGNGTKINGGRITEHELVEGDRIELGNSVLVFSKLGGAEVSERMPPAKARTPTPPPTGGPPRAATQERIVLAAERLAAELSERFRREEDGLDELPETSYERNKRAAPAPTQQSLSVVDDSDLAAEINQMVRQVSSPELKKLPVEDMWGDSETETRMPDGSAAAPPPAPVRAPTPPRLPASALEAVAPSVAARPNVVRAPPRAPPQMVTPPRHLVAPTEQLPNRGAAIDGPSYVHKTQHVAAKSRSPVLTALLGVLAVVLVGAGLGGAWYTFGDAILGDDGAAAAGDTTTGGADAPPPSAGGASSSTTTTAPGDASAKAEPAKSEPAKSEPAKAEPAKPEPAKSEPAKSEPAKSEPAKSEPAKSEPAKSEPAKSEPAKAEPAKAEPAKARVEEKPVAAKPAPKPERREAKASRPPPPKRDPDPPREREKPKDPPPAKAAPKGLDDGQARALVEKAVAALRNDDFDVACPILAKVAREAEPGSTWKLKAENLTRMRCQ